MSCVGRIKSTGAATPSSSSSRKRSPHHSGVDDSDLSRSKTKLLRVDNTTKHGGVETSYEINPTQSKQNDKKYDIGLDSLSNNNLSNYYKTATTNNTNNNGSKTSYNEENNNRGGSTPASPRRTPQNKKPLQPSPIIPNGTGNNNNDTSPPPQNETDILDSCNNKHDISGSNTTELQEGIIGDSILDDDEKKRIVDELINSLGGEKSNLKEIVPTILNHLTENQVLPIIKDVIIYTANLAQHTKAPKGERKQAKAKRLRNNKKLAAEARKIGDKARTKLYNLFVQLLGDEFKNRVNIERFDIEFMGFLIKHYGTQKENGKGTDDMNCHNPDSKCIKKLEKDAPTWCLNEQIDASVPKGKSFVIITKARANSSTTWAQPNALFPEKASQYEEVIEFLRSDKESIKLYFDTRTHALHWANKYFGNGAGVGTGYYATAVSGPPLPPHLESALPSLGLTDLESTTADNPNQKLTKKQKEAGVKPPPSLLDQRTVIAGKLGITVEQLLTINWAFQALQSVIFVLEHDRPAPLLIASDPATKFMIGEHIKHYGFIIRTGIVVIWRINHSQSIFEGAHLRWGEKHQHGINEAMSGFWSEVTQQTMFVNTKFSTSYPPNKKAELEAWREAWAAVKRGNETPEQRAILEGTRALLLHEGWKNVHSFGDLSELSAEFQDFFTNDPVGRRSWKVFDSWKQARSHDCNISDMPADVRDFFTNDPVGKQSLKVFDSWKQARSHDCNISDMPADVRDFFTNDPVGKQSLKVFDSWKQARSHDCNISDMPVDAQDFFTNDPVGKQSLKVFDSWKQARLHECNLSDMPADVRDFFTNDPFGKKSWDTFEAWKDLDANDDDISKVSEEHRAILEKNLCYKIKKAWTELYTKGDINKVSEGSRDCFANDISYKKKKAWTELYTKGDINKVSKESRAVLEKDHFYQRKEAWTELNTKGDINKVSKESRAVLEKDPVYQKKKASMPTITRLDRERIEEAMRQSKQKREEKKQDICPDVSASSAVSPPTIHIVNLNRGENGAVSNKILSKKVFVISGEWKEVCSDNFTATEAVKKAITRFGGKVNSIMSKKTDYFLAGAGASGGKFKSAENNNAVVIDLDRLQRVLLGLITLEQLHTMDKLDSISFYKWNYVQAVALAEQKIALAAQRQEEEKQDALRRKFPPMPMPMPIVSKPPRNQMSAAKVGPPLPLPSASQLEFLRQSCIQR